MSVARHLSGAMVRFVANAVFVGSDRACVAKAFGEDGDGARVQGDGVAAQADVAYRLAAVVAGGCPPAEWDWQERHWDDLSVEACAACLLAPLLHRSATIRPEGGRPTDGWYASRREPGGFSGKRQSVCAARCGTGDSSGSVEIPRRSEHLTGAVSRHRARRHRGLRECGSPRISRRGGTDPV